MRALLLSLPALLVGAGVLGAQASFPVADDLPAEARQFDFWIGTWDVNLRVHQEDLTWKDERQARARIHPILRGKAVLELWDESTIKGMSLRYFDTELDKWVLWLDWPGPNRAGSSRLEGRFRHGRVEFFGTRPNAEGGETISRYTFSDITPTSLRWDDAFSSDGGRTWTNNWIMEFARTGNMATLREEGGDAHTYTTGGRCTLPPFRTYEWLVGRSGGDGAGGGPALRGYRVLEGCAVLALLDWEEDGASRELFAHLTHNTYVFRQELLLLDSDPDSPARVYYGAEGSDELAFLEGRTGSEPLRRVRIEPGDGGGSVWSWDERVDADSAWHVVREVRVGT